MGDVPGHVHLVGLCCPVFPWCRQFPRIHHLRPDLMPLQPTSKCRCRVLCQELQSLRNISNFARKNDKGSCQGKNRGCAHSLWTRKAHSVLNMNVGERMRMRTNWKVGNRLQTRKQKISLATFGWAIRFFEEEKKVRKEWRFKLTARYSCLWTLQTDCQNRTKCSLKFPNHLTVAMIRCEVCDDTNATIHCQVRIPMR